MPLLHYMFSNVCTLYNVCILLAVVSWICFLWIGTENKKKYVKQVKFVHDVHCAARMDTIFSLFFLFPVITCLQYCCWCLYNI